MSLRSLRGLDLLQVFPPIAEVHIGGQFDSGRSVIHQHRILGVLRADVRFHLLQSQADPFDIDL